MSYKHKTYSPGRFDTLIQIKAKQVTKDDYGEETVTLVPFANDVWAEKDYQAGREFWAGTAGSEGSKKAKKVVKYVFYYIEGLTEEMVIVDDNQEYDITSVSDVNRQQYHMAIAEIYV